MRKMIAGILTICAALGWWGALYPQFTLVEGTYRIVEEKADFSEEKCEETALDGSGIYWSLLEADCSQIRFKSRLLTEWREFHESGN